MGKGRKVAEYLRETGRGMHEPVRFQDLANLQGEDVPADEKGEPDGDAAGDAGERQPAARKSAARKRSSRR